MEALSHANFGETERVSIENDDAKKCHPRVEQHFPERNFFWSELRDVGGIAHRNGRQLGVYAGHRSAMGPNLVGGCAQKRRYF